MKRQAYEASRTKKVLLDKMRKGEKYVLWRLNANQKRTVEALGLYYEPWYYEVRTRNFNQLMKLSPLLRDIQTAHRKGKRTIVRQYTEEEVKRLRDANVGVYVAKYKIHLN